MKANVYVDGFNLYYGAVKNTPYLCMDFEREVGHPDAEEHAATAEEVWGG